MRPKPTAASTGRVARLLGVGRARAGAAGGTGGGVASLSAVVARRDRVAASPRSPRSGRRRGDRRRASRRSRGCAPDARGSCARGARCGPTSATCSSRRCAPGCRCPTRSRASPTPRRRRCARRSRRSRAMSRHPVTSTPAPSVSRSRSPIRSADRIVETLRMARQVGGTELTPVLRALAASVRADAALRAEVESRQSWIRGAAVLGVAAPWVILALLAMRPEGARAYGSPEGVALILAGAAVSFVAYRIMLRHRPASRAAAVVRMMPARRRPTSRSRSCSAARSASACACSSRSRRGGVRRRWRAGSRRTSAMSPIRAGVTPAARHAGREPRAQLWRGGAGAPREPRRRVGSRSIGACARRGGRWMPPPSAAGSSPGRSAGVAIGGAGVVVLVLLGRASGDARARCRPSPA